MRTRWVITAILAFACVFSSFAADDSPAAGNSAGAKMRFSGYSGGMMVHSGYVWGKECIYTDAAGHALSTQQMAGMPLGIGGAMKFGFGKHLRVGAEGYVSVLNFGKHKSHSSTGWGGVLADCMWQHGRWSWFVGGTFGGGSVRNTVLLADMPLDFVLEEDRVSYRKYGFIALVPFAGCEYALTPRVHLVAKVDWIFNVSNPQPDFITGPRLYLGFMFTHSR